MNYGSRDIGDVVLELRAEIERLKRPSSIIIGQWSVHESQYGDLVADNLNTGVRRVVAMNDESLKTGPVKPGDRNWNRKG